MPNARLRGITLDCADPTELAGFYAKLTGMTVSFSSDDYVALSGGSGAALGFQRVQQYRPPRWPGQEVPQQLHLDFAVSDIEQAEAAALSAGATIASEQPGDAGWRVLLDPAGHPFCLAAERSA